MRAMSGGQPHDFHQPPQADKRVRAMSGVLPGVQVGEPVHCAGLKPEAAMAWTINRALAARTKKSGGADVGAGLLAGMFKAQVKRLARRKTSACAQ